MRVFLAAIIVTLFVAFGLRAESPKPVDTREYQVLSTLDLIALNENRRLGAVDPTGMPVEVLLVPNRIANVGERDFLQDDITGLTCAPSSKSLKRVGKPGDDFLVVRGVLSQPDAAGVREIVACRVVGWEGVKWEEERTIAAAKQDSLYRAGRL